MLRRRAASAGGPSPGAPPEAADAAGGEAAGQDAALPPAKRRRHWRAEPEAAASASQWRSVTDVFDEHARARPSHVAVVELSGRRDSFTWRELQEYSVDIAYGLVAELEGLRGSGELAGEEVAIMMKRSCLWLAATVAVLRCGWPFVWLSAGEAPAGDGAAAPQTSPAEVARQAKWWLRNAAILRLTSPCCLLLGEDVHGDALPHLEAHAPRMPPVKRLGDLLRRRPSRDASADLLARARDAAAQRLPGQGGTLCYMFTGGSTGSPKCVETTHAMALHEVRRYPSIAPLGPADRVLQNTSVFWAASAWGQVDIALAGGSALCISAAASPSTRSLLEAGITALGSAPSVLSQLAPEELPCMRCAFSWGEAMPPAVAARWRSAGVRLVELLISTEYWLGFYSDGPSPRCGGPGTVFKVIEGLDFAVLPLTEGEESAKLVLAPGAVGELCVRGPGVMRGYKHGEDAFVEADGGRYYRARDIVKVVEASGGYAIEFHGRSDALIKVGAEFVNLSDVEAKLEGLQQCGGVSACLLPPRGQGRGPSAHAFLAAGLSGASGAEAAKLLRSVRSALPRGAALHVVDKLPRDETTGKVDRRALAQHVAASEARSTPLGQAEQWSMLWHLLKRYPLSWMSVVLLCSLDLLVNACWLCLCDETSSIEGLWSAWLLRLLLLPYLWLLSFRLLPNRCLDVIPLGRCGGVVAVIASGLWHSPLADEPRLARSLWVAVGLVGMSIAAYEGRVASWPIAFWLGVPHTLTNEAAWWLKFSAWRWWLCQGLPSAPWKLRQAWCEAPQFEAARRLLKPLAGACPQTKTPALVVGSQLRVWSVTQQTWLPAQVIKTYGDWVTVRYSWPDGQVFEKQLVSNDAQLRSPGRFLLVQERCMRWLVWPVHSLVSFVCALPWRSGRADESEAQVATKADADFDKADFDKDAMPAGSAAAAGTAPHAEGASRKSLEEWPDARYRGYTLREWRWWERKWWEDCPLDVVDITMPDEAAPDEEMAPAAEAEERLSAFEARLLQLVERHLHPGPARLTMRLSGADSLSFMAFCRAVRSELHRQLEPEVAMGCETPAQLLQHLESQPTQEEAAHPAAPSDRQGSRARSEAYRVYFAPSQLRGKCAWLYETPGPLDAECFRAAAARLVERHEALRYTVLDPPELVPFVQLPAGLLSYGWPYVEEFIQRQAWSPTKKRLAARLVAGLQRLTSFGLKGSWPRVGARSGRSEPAVHVRRCPTWNDVLQGMQAQNRAYEVPFCIGLYTLEPPQGEGAAAARSYVHFVCTHAFSDGYTCFPLINDLAELYEAESAKNGKANAGPPVLPSAFGVLQQRLFDALDARPSCSASEQSSLRFTEFFPPEPLQHEPNQYNHMVKFDCSAIAALRKYGRDYAVPLDVSLLGVVAGALLRSGVSDAAGKLTGEVSPAQLLTLCLYAPMRDGAANEGMVGLFSDWREVSLATGCGISVLGLLLELTSIIRARQWAKFDALQNSQRILVNILPLDERPRGSCDFRQTRSHEYFPEKLHQQRHRFWRRGSLRPMRLTLEQFELKTWWLSLDLSDDCFPPAWCRLFVVNLEKTLHDLVHRPLVPLL